MSEMNLGIKAKEALRHIRNSLMHHGKFPSVRELMTDMGYKSPRSAMLLIDELTFNGFLERREDGSLKMVKDLSSGIMGRTVTVPLVGVASCGIPMLAQENIEAMIPVSISLAKAGSKYFLLRAVGDSMDKAGITHGDLILVKQQSMADDGQYVVALIDDEATVKEFRKKGGAVALLPRSSNPKHKPILLEREFQIQGIVITTISNVNF